MASTVLSLLPSLTKSSGQYHQGMPLAEHAARLYPGHQFNQDAWVRAVGYLRRNDPSIWRLDRVVDATSETNRY